MLRPGSMAVYYMSKCEHGERITKFCIGEQCRHRQAAGCDYCIKKHHFHLANANLLAEHDLDSILHALTPPQDNKFKNRALIELSAEYLRGVRQACGNWLDQAQTAVADRLSFPLLRREGLLQAYQRIKSKDYRRLNAQDLRAIHDYALATPAETYKRQQLAAYFVEVEQVAVILHAAEGLAHALERLPALGPDLPAPPVPSFGARLHEVITEILREKGKHDGHTLLPKQPPISKTESSKLQELMKESSLLKNRISRELSYKQQREGKQEERKRGSTPGKEPFLEIIHKRQSSNGIGKEPMVSANNKEQHLEFPPIHGATTEDKKKRNRRASIDDKLQMKFGAADKQKQAQLKKRQALDFLFPLDEGQNMRSLQNDAIPAPPPSAPYDQSEVRNKVVKIPILMPKTKQPFADEIESPIFKTKRKQDRLNNMQAPLKELPLTQVVQVQREDSYRQIPSQPIKKQEPQEFILQASEKYSLLLFSEALKSDSQRAIDLLVAALKYSPNNLSAAEYLSFLYLQAGLAKECLEVCQAILHRIANRGDEFQVTLHLHNNRAAALNMLGRYSQSIVILEKCLKYRRKHYFYKNLADAYFSLGIPQKAAMNYEKAVRLDPAYDEAYYNLAVCQFMQSEYVSAQLNVEQALHIDPTNETYLELKMQVATRISNCVSVE